MVAVFGVAAIGFAIFGVAAYNDAGTAKATLTEQKKAAATAAADDQKKKDDQANEIANESPFRSYVAPIEYGSFEIKFPKNWSATVDQERSQLNQVTMVVHPDFVRIENSQPELSATKVMLQQRTLDEFLRTYNGQKSVTRTDIVVDGIKGVQLGGKIPDKRINRIVVLPIRDKCLVFVLEDSQYAPQFDQILAQSNLVP